MIVLDASALVEFVADRTLKPWVSAMLAANEIAAPAHQQAEVVSALARLVRAGDISEVHAAAAVAEAATLHQDVRPLDVALLERAWTLRERIRVLDGIYVALAERLDAPLVSTDTRLLRANPPCEVLTPPTA